jgi:hypothetical protein
MNRRINLAALFALAATLALVTLLAACGGVEHGGSPTLFYRGV